jgi:hypothetical protein
MGKQPDVIGPRDVSGRRGLVKVAQSSEQELRGCVVRAWRMTKPCQRSVGLVSPALRWLPNRWHYAWIIVAVCFGVSSITAGVRSAPGVLIVPLEHEFGWSRATISFALGVNLVLFGAIGRLQRR